VSRNVVAVAWLAGIVLAALVYVAGPDRLVLAIVDAGEATRLLLQDLARNLTLASFELVRALAIGLFATFAVLAVAAVRRGHKGRGALVMVSAVFMLLVWDQGGYESASRWVGALVLAAVGAVVMTSRLTAAPQPWRIGRGRPDPHVQFRSPGAG
jgi:hypothetical protein